MPAPIDNVVFRPATIEDAEALSKFMHEIADEPLNTIPGIRFSPEEEKIHLEDATKKDRAFFLLALDGARVIGMLDIQAGEKPHTRHQGRLGISVLAPYRNHGVGWKLLEMAIGIANTWEGFCRIELEVVPWHEAAIHLYESVGFVAEGRKRKSGAFHGIPHDLKLMALVW